MPNHAPLAERAAAEVEELHAFFVRWLDAVDPDPKLTLDRFAAVAAPGFRLIPPTGAVLERQAVIDWLASSRASRGTPERPFVIATEKVEARQIGADTCLVTYVERQGLMISWEVLEPFGYHGPVDRLKLGALDDLSIRSAFSAMATEPDSGERDYAAYLEALCRQHEDDHLGLNGTRDDLSGVLGRTRTRRR